MKKIVVFTFVFGSLVSSIFANGLVRIDVVDDFGDPSGESYITCNEDLVGTYTNSYGKGNLLWNFNINTSTGELFFILKEDGKDTDVSTSSSSLWYTDSGTRYKVTFKKPDGTTVSKIGVLTNSETYQLNRITVCNESSYYGDYEDWNCLALFLSDSSLKIVIKSDYGSYSLGTIELGEFEGVVYDKESYNEGVRLMVQGKYQDALDVFFDYEKSDLDAYEHYDTYAKVVECYKQLGSYTIGMVGPSGGCIFYDCDADNNSGNADGLVSSECGWRYLEAAPMDLSSNYCFGFDRDSDYGDNLIIGTETDIGSGKANTQKLVMEMGETAYCGEFGCFKEIYAAKACTDYSITVNGVVYDDWFLPSKDELNLMCINLKRKGLGGFSIYSDYMSSSEVDAHNLWGQSFLRGGYQYDDCSRRNDGCIRPARAFSVCSDGNVNHAWDSGVETTSATCVSAGTKTYTCIVCGQTKTDVFFDAHEKNYCSRCGHFSKGPAGGYVFYDCDADNDSGNADGLVSSECGWRYLEAAPEDLTDCYRFGYYRDSDGYMEVGTATATGTGEANTESLVGAMGETGEGITYAAKACVDYSITVDGVAYDDWFLPSKDELALMFENLEVNGFGSFASSSYWSSSEYSAGSAWEQDFSSGFQYYSSRDSGNRVRPVRAFR